MPERKSKPLALHSQRRIGHNQHLSISGDRSNFPFQSQWEIPDKGADHFTFRSDHPEVEIDYALLHKDSRWSVSEIDVIEEPVVSDHRPLVLEIIEER